MSGPEWEAPYQYGYRTGDRIGELLQNQGQIRAQGALRSGEIFANLGSSIAGIGRQLGEGLAAEQAKKDQKEAAAQLARRDAAMVAFVESWDGQDPKALHTGLVKILGPAEGMKMAQGVLSFQSLSEKAGEKDVQNFGTTLKTAAALPYPVFERWWPGIRGKAAPAAERLLGVPAAELPEQATPELYQTIQGMAQSLTGKAEEDYTLTPGAQRRRGSQIVAENPAAPPKGPAVGSLEDYISRFAATIGKTPEQLQPAEIDAVRKRYQQADNQPAAPPQPSFQAKEVLDDTGQPVMANFDARTGHYLNASTGEPIKAPRPVPTADTRDAGKFKQAAPVLRSIAELSEKINTQQGLIAKVSGGAERVAAKANLDDDVAEYQALVMGFTPLVARALGHTGVLTEQDVQSVRALFPSPGDSKTLRDRKIARVSSIVAELEGKPPAGAPPPAPGAAGPARGERRTINGQLAEWDGNGWLAVR